MAERPRLKIVKTGLDDHLEKKGAASLRDLPDQLAQPPEGLTDTGNARRLVRRHGQDIRWCEAWGSWLVWDGQRWRRDDTREIDRHAKETAQSILIEAANETDDMRRQNLSKWAVRSESAHNIKAMIELAKSEPSAAVRVEDLDRDPWLLNTLNGTIDLRTGKHREHRREDLITKLAPVEYDLKARCPVFEKTLAQILPHKALVEFMRRVLGYSLTGQTSEQCLILMHGQGANGKTTILESVKQVLGDYAAQASAETWMVRRDGGIPNDIARLRGARFVTTSETEDGRRLAESLVKQVTGGDVITARFLFKEFFEFTPQFKIFIAANHKPVIRGDDYAIWRRIRLVPFAVTIPPEKQDRALVQKLKAERPGILNWMLKGCLTWQRQGLNVPPEIEQATDTYRSEMDAIRSWIEARCVTGKDKRGQATELYRSYNSWAEDSGEHRRDVMPQRTFLRRLEEKGYQRRKTNSGYVYYGIAPKGKKL